MEPGKLRKNACCQAGFRFPEAGFSSNPTGAKSTEDFAVRRPEGRYIRSRAPHGVKKRTHKGTNRRGCQTPERMMDIFLGMMDVFSGMTVIFPSMLDNFFSI
jgi:hypothetical protein